MTTKRRPRGPDRQKRKPRVDAAAVAAKLAERNRLQTRKGQIQPLTKGSVSAIKGLRWRVPECAPEVLADAADEAFETVVEVMRGNVRKGQSMPRLAAARVVREEVCGPLAQRHEHTGVDGKPIEIVDLAALERMAAAVLGAMARKAESES